MFYFFLIPSSISLYLNGHVHYGVDLLANSSPMYDGGDRSYADQVISGLERLNVSTNTHARCIGIGF